MSPGGRAEAPDACISDIKEQKHSSGDRLDYYWNLLEKLVDKNRSQRKQKFRDRIARSVYFAKTSGGNYTVLDQELGDDARQNELLRVYSGLCLVRKIKKSIVDGDFKINRVGGKKKKITTFSKRSRLNMMKHLGMMKHRPEFWFDLTYADDVVVELTQEQRKLKSSEDLHQLKRWMEREGIEANGAWKREWKKRKSGKLEGEDVPHFHIVVWIGTVDDRKYLETYFRIVDKWLQITGTQGEYEMKARHVLYHKNSFRFIKSQKQMRKYMQKYISKNEDFVTDESIGRSWGLIGDPIEENPEEIEVENNEMVLLKRMLRNFCKGINKKVKYGLNFCLSHEFTQFFVLIERQTVLVMLEYIRSGTFVEGVPF